MITTDKRKDLHSISISIQSVLEYTVITDHLQSLKMFYYNLNKGKYHNKPYRLLCDLTYVNGMSTHFEVLRNGEKVSSLALLESLTMKNTDDDLRDSLW